MASLIVVTGAHAGETFQMASDPGRLFVATSRAHPLPALLSFDERTRGYTVALFEHRGRWLLVPKLSANGEVRVNGRPLVGMAVLRQDDQIDVGTVMLRFVEEIKRVVSAQSPENGRACQVCHDTFGSGNTVIECPRCGLVHHEDCWEDAGCASRPACGYVVSAARKAAGNEAVRT